MRHDIGSVTRRLHCAASDDAAVAAEREQRAGSWTSLIEMPTMSTASAW
jgi:hypothetical protein